MTTFYFVSIFPELIEDVFKYSLLSKAVKKKIICFKTINPRDFSNNKHRQIDDYPYGGGPGMVMMAPPIVEAVESIKDFNNKDTTALILLTPRGEKFDHNWAKRISKKDNIIFICGHYEGIDERVVDILKPIEISLGDFVTMGGELPALIMTEVISRFIPGVIGDMESVINDSFYNGVLDFPNYTRPYEYRGLKVPNVLLSGHHAKIREWRMKKSEEITQKRRPDLLKR